MLPPPRFRILLQYMKTCLDLLIGTGFAEIGERLSKDVHIVFGVGAVKLDPLVGGMVELLFVITGFGRPGDQTFLFHAF